MLWESLGALFTPMPFMMLILGVLVGTIIGILPAIGAVTGLALLLPFTFKMGPEAALPLLIGLLAITTTSDTITSVLIGAPGTEAGMATILDGYPMARKGEAGIALGAAFTVSAIGGVLGAAMLTVSIPVFRPLVLALGSPEFFMLGILGISMVAALAGKHLIRGLIAGGLGILIALIGEDPVLGVTRWAFGQPYLVGGISIVPMAMGIFAIPELVDLCVRGTQIAEQPKQVIKGKIEGVKKAFQNKFLVGSSSLVGGIIGFIPGMGAIVAQWIGYAWGIMISKPKDMFGKGDIRGVLAPESACAACKGGALIPTLAFGVPGGTATALILGALIIQGITPGPRLLTEHLDLVYLIIWSLVIANIVGAGLCFLMTDQLALLTKVRIHILAPLVFVLIFAGTLMTTTHIGDIVALLGFSILGLVMKRLDWARPPLVLGFILAPLLELYFFRSMLRYGFEWLLRPGVVIIGIVAILGIYFSVRLQRSLIKK